MASGGLALCSCGTYAIGQCQRCEQQVCGGCSMMSAGARVCRAHVAEDRRRSEERAEAERLKREAAVREQERLADELANSPLDLTVEEAFEVCYLAPTATRQEVNSAVRVLSELSEQRFTTLARRQLTGRVPTSRFCMWSGRTKGLVGGAMSALRTYDVWWFIESSFALTTSGRWIGYSSGSMEGGSYNDGGKSFRKDVYRAVIGRDLMTRNGQRPSF